MLKWFSPLEGEEITDIALHYVFEAAKGASYYTVYASRNADFSEAFAASRFPQKEGCVTAYYLPKDEELFAAGDWYIRAAADTGEETETIRFSVNDLHTKAPLRTKISRDHPLITIFDHSRHRYGAEYDVLPEDLKEYCAINGGAGWGTGPDGLYEKTMACDEKGYPWIGHFFSHAEVRDGQYVITPLPIAEKILKNAKNLRAIAGLEIYMGVRPDEDWVVTIYRRVVMLCGKYGIPFLHVDGNRNDIDLAAVIKRPVFAEVLREYADYTVISYKQNHANTSYSCYGAVLGGWIDGMFGNIGIQAENWYWNDAGFCDDIGGYHGYLQGNEQQTPAVFTAQMLIPAVSLGCTHFSLEGEGWLIRMRGTEEYEYSPQGIAVLSMLRTVIRKHMIPAKEEVLSQVKAVVTADGSGKDWGDAWCGGVFRKAFQNLYGIIHTKELFPKQLRYFYLPFMSDRPEVFSNLMTVDVKDIHEPDDMNRLLNPLYPEWFAGNAYVTRSGGTFAVMNSRENTDESQYYEVPLTASDGKPLVVKAEGAIGLWQFFLLKNEGHRTYIHMNARRDSVLTIRLTAEDGQGLSLKQAGNEVQFRRDSASDTYELTLIGNDEPAECVLYAEGEEAEEPLSPLKNRPFTETFLSNMKPVKLSGGLRGVPAIDYMANQMYGKLPIAMNAIRYPHGISLPRKSSISYDLGGKYSSLTMTVGFDIDVWMPIIVNHEDIVWDRYEKDISIIFRVYGDEKLLYESPALTSTFYREVLTLNVSGIRELTFTMDGEIHEKPLWCAITGTADRYLYDASGRSDLPPAEVYLDLGNPILS